VGGATHEAIEAVCNAKEDLRIDLLDAIESLVDNSLVRRTSADLTEPRFVMLETMREYGLARLAEAGEEAYTRKAHAAYCVILAEEGQPLMRSVRQQEWWARFDAEIGNIRAALDWLIASGEVEWGLWLAGGLQFYWTDRGLTEEAFERLQKLFALPGADLRTKIKGNALVTAADMAGYSGRKSDRVRFSAESVALFEELNDPQGLLRSLTHGGVSDRAVGDYPAARAQFERAVNIARELGDSTSLARALSNLADLVKLQGEFELSRLLQLEAARLFETMGDQNGAAWSLSHQADLAREQGGLERARSLYEQALSRFRTLENQQGIASCFHDLAAISAAAGDYPAAQRLYRESLRLYLELGNHIDFPRLLESLAACFEATQAPEGALTLAGAAAAIRQRLVAPLTDSAKAKLDRMLANARGKLTSAEATASWMRGWTMEMEEAVRFALGA
jgi:tetratricopeptide (TPR) repeat protein